jgi:hypothetical protein
MTETVLDLDTIGFPSGADRGISQTLEPIEAIIQRRRTINGTLVNIALDQFRKYKSSVNCTDQVPPALDGVWPGDVITVKCIAELSYLTSGGSPSRTVVSGSSRVDGSYTFYRPQLSMMVANINVRADEFGAVVGWSVDLEEV